MLNVFAEMRRISLWREKTRLCVWIVRGRFFHRFLCVIFDFCYVLSPLFSLRIRHKFIFKANQAIQFNQWIRCEMNLSIDSFIQCVFIYPFPFLSISLFNKHTTNSILASDPSDSTDWNRHELPRFRADGSYITPLSHPHINDGFPPVCFVVRPVSGCSDGFGGNSSSRAPPPGG